MEILFPSPTILSNVDRESAVPRRMSLLRSESGIAAAPSLDELIGIEPERVAAELSHLPGFLYLDSSSVAQGGETARGAQFSLITAEPRRVIRGDLFCEADFQRLSQRWREGCSRHAASASGFHSLPGPGLYGTINYDGRFTFGEYDHVLLYDHSVERWMESGNLSLRRQAFHPRSLSSIAFEPSVSREQFCEMVRSAISYIAAGDIYQVNLSHRFSTERRDVDLFSLYLRLREVSPAPYSAFVSLGGRTVLSSSPEEFLRMSGQQIRTRPIKGTRPRFSSRERDEASARELLSSAKERSELVMITDLERNDIGQVCDYGSVRATALLELEPFAQVFHLVSTVEGVLRNGVSHLDALRACFPGGSISGAPKKRAREVIAELETRQRGLYTGAIGGFGFQGESCFNIAIRTLVNEGEHLYFDVGAGIVADSIPEKEWEETLHKAAGILRACS